MFEKRRKAKEAERVAEEERRMNYAADREREKVEAERAEKAEKAKGQPDVLHKFDFIGEKVDRYEESRGNKRVKKARIREGKRIRKEKNRKYWVILAVVLALIAGCVGGYLVGNHMMQKKCYSKATELIINDEFGKAAAILEELDIKDSDRLCTYAVIRTNVKAYDGKMNEMLKKLNSLEPLENNKVETQYKEFTGKVEPAGKLQKDINKLDVDKLRLSDKNKVEELNKRVKQFKGKYADMVDTHRIKAAEKKIQVLEEATKKLQNQGKDE